MLTRRVGDKVELRIYDRSDPVALVLLANGKSFSVAFNSVDSFKQLNADTYERIVRGLDGLGLENVEGIAGTVRELQEVCG